MKVNELKITITPKNDIPAFAGYLSGSVREPEAKIVVNIEGMVNAAANKDNGISFKDIFTTSVVHEILHAVEDIYHREFDEEEVESVIKKASEFICGECHKEVQYEPQNPDEWIKPVMKGYRMQCCDCGLIHELDFNVVHVLERYENGEKEVADAGEEYEVEFMARRV